MTNKFIPLHSVNRNFAPIPASQRGGYRTDLDLPRTPTLTADQRRAVELLEKRQKIRKRNVRALRQALEGKPIAEIAAYYGTTEALVRVWMSEMLQLLFFRAKDRTGLTALPRGPLAVLTQSAFWLQKLNDNEDVMMELDPTKLTTTQVAHDNLAPRAARPVYSRHLSNSH